MLRVFFYPFVGGDYIQINRMQIQFDDIGKILSTCFVYLFVAIFIGISQAAGIGGGPIINICLIIGLGIETKTSMAITYIFLIGGSVASIYSNYGKKIADKSKNLIDTNLVIITLPLTVSGSIFGALFNHFISEFIITIAFSILLSYLAVSSYKKFRQSQQAQLRAPLIPQVSIELQEIGKKQEINPRLLKILEEEDTPFPIQKLKLFGQIIAITVVLLLFKGGSSFESVIGLTKCGMGTWVCVILHLIISIYYAKSIALKQERLDEEKISLGYKFQHQSDKMSDEFLMKAMLLGFSGGFAGGMLGIGGAIILVPAWLEMGMDKNIASSSSSPLILASAFISMIIAFLCQYYDSFVMIVFYFALSFFASYYIKQVINWVKRKYHLQGMIFILLIIVMVMSLVFLLPYSFFKMIDDPEQFFSFGHMC